MLTAVAAIAQALAKLPREDRERAVELALQADESPEEREKRKARERKRRWRDGSGTRAGPGRDNPGQCPASVPEKRDQNGTLSRSGHGDVPGPPSLSLSDSPSFFVDPERSTPKPPAPARGETVSPMQDDAELPEEWRSAVEILGVLNVPDEWSKFRAHHIAKGTVTDERGWRALFVGKWALDARKYQSRGGRSPVRVRQEKPVGGSRWEETPFDLNGTEAKR